MNEEFLYLSLNLPDTKIVSKMYEIEATLNCYLLTKFNELGNVFLFS